MLDWLRRSLGTSSRGARAAMSVLDEVWHPGAARAREDQETRHERSVPAPSPGDRLLRTGRVRIGRRANGHGSGRGDRRRGEVDDVPRA